MKARRFRGRRGIALLEVLIGLVILATAGSALMALGRDALNTLQHVVEKDREFERASAFLDAVTLWNRTELDQRLGRRRQGPWLLTVQREAPSLYVVTLHASVTRVLLRTSLYRGTSGSEP